MTIAADVDVESAPPPGSKDAFLRVDDLRVHFPTEDGIVKSVDGLTFELVKGRTLGIVGESGSGKSVTSQAIMGLHRNTRAKVTGSIWLDGEELLGVSNKRLRQLRGNSLAMIFQDPLSSLHPYYTIGNQIVEAYQVHHDVRKRAARARVIDMLARVGIPNPQQRIDQYPHEFSGGMRQRAMIAMALVNDPKLLIADEPTTALDVTVQAQILDLLKDLQREFGSAIIIITHDLGVVAEVADDIMVMYGGKAVEYSPVDDTFYSPEHPYTWGLLASMPRMDKDRQARLVPIMGNPPSLLSPPPGCAFHPRCNFTEEVGPACHTTVPAFDPPHPVRCHIDRARRHELFTTVIQPTL